MPGASRPPRPRSGEDVDRPPPRPARPRGGVPMRSVCSMAGAFTPPPPFPPAPLPSGRGYRCASHSWDPGARRVPLPHLAGTRRTAVTARGRAARAPPRGAAGHGRVRQKAGNFPKSSDVYLSNPVPRPLSQGGPQLATAIGPHVRAPAPSPQPVPPRRTQRLRARSFTRSPQRLATSAAVIYATSTDIQTRQGTFDSPTRWTYWRVQPAGTVRRVPHVLEGREVPR